MRTEYEFVLPRGYLDENDTVHRRGTMRLATARDELEPLRDPTLAGPDDPRLTIVVLARVTQTLGTLTLVTPHEIEGLFAADLAYLQDFYGVINFGTEAEIEELLAAQREMLKPAAPAPERAVAAPPAAPPASAPAEAEPAPGAPVPPAPTSGVTEYPTGRRGSIEEVPTGGR